MSKLKRPRDINQIANLVGRMATGEVENDYKEPSQDSINARLGGLKGGKKRAKVLSPARRKEIAQKAAKARWSK